VIHRLNAALQGRYRIERELGQGGMATVFLAEDVKHHRNVALKVLKPELAAVVGGERFLAEIETTANLQHPHILPLYDSGEADSFLFYVMPFVEGESLREKLDRERQLPVSDAVRIARSIASGLDYAHRQGVVHRDIKPANILLQDGEPVIADFGIALAVQQAGGGRLTETGLSLGTPYYMSPEQATAERDPGPRSDVYSLGCVLYEMLTGEPPFTGNTAQAVLGKILTAEAVAPTRLRGTIPPHVEAAILDSLAKLPADRFASAADFARALSDAGADRPRVAAGAAGHGSGRRYGPAWLPAPVRAWTPWGIAGVAVLALAVVLGSNSWRASPGSGAPVVRAVLELPADAAMVGARVAIAGDGSVVTVVGDMAGRRMILARRLGERDFFPVEGSQGGDFQFLSPDGRYIAFRAGGMMRRVPLTGGPPTTLDAESQWAGGDWAEDGRLVYSRSYRSGLWTLSPGGTEPERLTEPATGELAHWWPQVLPGGKHVLFTAFRTPIDDAQISILSLETGERRDILRGAVHARYVATGHLIFARGEALHAVPFDLRSMRTAGDAVMVVEDVAMEHPSGMAWYDISRDGTLVYVPASDANAPSDLVWVTRSGHEEPVIAEQGRYSNPALSPDGRSLAVALAVPGQSADLWTFDLVRGTRSRIGAGGGTDFGPVWSPSGDRLIYTSERPVFDLYWRPADGSAPAAQLVASGHDTFAGSFTPHGDTLLYVRVEEPHRQLWRLALGGGEPELVYAPSFNLTEPALSPDGRWLAYVSDESGTEQVYLASYPDLERIRRQVSARGGLSPRWTRGGRELVYADGARMMSVTWESEAGELGRPEVLFEGPYLLATNLGTRNYDVTPDGERFLMVKRPRDRAPRRVMVVTGFFEELRALGGAGVR
jgi:eukaryotic-like serine/threonine-protein kinase